MKIQKRFFILLISVVFLMSGTLAYATYQRKDIRILQPKEMRLGTASWYSRKSPGIKKTTANMEIFDDTAMTCAMWDAPFNQMLRVTNLENGKSVVVRVNDRGPHKRYVRKGRVVDLSKSAFQKIGNLKKGLVSVRVEFL